MTVYSYGLSNEVKDLSDVLSTLIAQSPTFVHLFKPVENAISRKHEWAQDVLRPRTISYTAYNQSTGVFTVTDSSGWSVGDCVRVSGDSAVFRITAVTSTSITVQFVASQGSTTDAIGDIATTAGTLIFDYHPIEEASTSGVELFSQSGTDYNYTQIFRGDVKLSKTALAVRVVGNENQISVQLERGLKAITHQINRAALFGVRTQATSSTNGVAGGLYCFGTQSGGLSVDASGAALSVKLINDAAQEILNAGGTPDTVICGNGQARVISQLMRSQITITQDSGVRGSFANRLFVESTGDVLNVLVEPALDALDGHVWLVDSRGFGLSNLQGRGMTSTPSNNPEMDALKWSLLGEMTFEFKNSKQTLCLIRGLRPSASTLA
ncbi:MAG: DUF5309 family protein [Planctomycetia bacterium]|nr:DUF5309 family protein [Planctomycetia bacterium]